MDSSKPLVFGNVVIEPGRAAMAEEEHELGDAPLELQYEAEMHLIARTLDQIFNGEARGEARQTGFVLLVFPFGNDGRCNYISNGADRADMVILLRHQADKFEADILAKAQAAPEQPKCP